MNGSRMLSIGLVFGIWFASEPAVRGQEKTPREKKPADLAREVAAAREKGLDWLTKNQAEDGSWGKSYTLGITSTWAATSKIQLVANASYKQRKLDDAFNTGGTGAVTAKDRTTRAGLGIRWQPLRAFDIGCDINYEQRKVDSSSTLTTPYKATVGGCSAQFALR